MQPGTLRSPGNFARTSAEEQMATIAKSIREDPSFLRPKIAQQSAEIADAINQRYRVYCLSTKPDLELMWAHYCEKHQGVCLEFGTDNEVFASALKIEYRESYPKYDVTSDNDYENIAPLIHKSSAWAYENEYRLIAQERANSTPHQTLKCDANLLTLPNRSLQSIILGCSATMETRALVKKIVAEHGSNISYQRGRSSARPLSIAHTSSHELNSMRPQTRTAHGYFPSAVADGKHLLKR